MNERADFSDSENDILLAHDGSVINDDETACQLVKSDKETGVPIYYKRKLSLRVYRRRWVILVLFSLLSFMQCAVWNTWGPVSDSSLAAYPSWGPSTIALFGNWGTITYVGFTAPFMWLCDVYGLRVGVLASAFLMAAGTAVRCISTSEGLFTWMAHLGANLNGVAGIVMCSVPPALSSLWFPPNERTTATGISTVFNQLGNAGGFLLGPLLIREPEYKNETLVTSVALLRSDINRLMQVEASICLILFVSVLIYFPARPPLPPSMASTIARLNIKQGFMHLLKNREVILLTTAFSFSQGILGVWLGVMDINLDPLGMSQAESGWLGVCAIVSSCVLALVIARLVDIVTGHLKLIITILLCISSAAFVFLTLMGLALIEPTTSRLYVAIITGSCANYAATPLFYELAAEVAFPVDEVIVGGFMSCIYNLVGAVFLFAFFIPNIGVTWMNYCLVAAPAAALPFVFMAKEEYRRSRLDSKMTRAISANNNENTI